MMTNTWRISYQASLSPPFRRQRRARGHERTTTPFELARKFHLAKVYRKLDLRARTELARHFAAQVAPPPRSAPS